MNKTDQSFFQFTCNWFSGHWPQIWMSCIQVQNFEVGKKIERAASSDDNVECGVGTQVKSPNSYLEFK